MVKLKKNFDQHKSVAIFISRFPPPYGGVSNQAKSLAEKLSIKHNIKIYTLDLLERKVHSYHQKKWENILLFSRSNFTLNNIIESFYLFISSVNYWKGFSLFKLDKFILWRLVLLYISSFLGSILNDEKVVLIYSFHIGAPSVVGGNLASIFEVPHMKGVFGEFYTNSAKINIQKKFIRSVSGEKFYFPCSRHCDQLMKLVFDNVQSKVLYYGSDLKSLHKSSNDFNSSSVKVFHITFLGRHEKEMGVNFFLKLIEILNNNNKYSYKFNLVGQSGKLTDRINKFADNKSFNLNIYTSVSHEFKNKILCNSDFLIVPSLNERACFGLAIVEGIASRNIVLARNIGGHKEAALNNNDFLFDRESTPDMIAYKVEKLCKEINQKKIEKILNLYQKKIIDKYDIEICLGKQLKKIEDIINLK